MHMQLRNSPEIVVCPEPRYNFSAVETTKVGRSRLDEPGFPISQMPLTGFNRLARCNMMVARGRLYRLMRAKRQCNGYVR
jgi:hypothetical protein